jgi:hypothetical protein
MCCIIMLSAIKQKLSICYQSSANCHLLQSPSSYWRQTKVINSSLYLSVICHPPTVNFSCRPLSVVCPTIFRTSYKYEAGCWCRWHRCAAACCGGGCQWCWHLETSAPKFLSTTAPWPSISALPSRGR